MREGGNVEYAIWSGLYRIYDTYLYNIYNLLVYNKYKGITSKLDTLYSSVVYVKTVELHRKMSINVSMKKMHLCNIISSPTVLSPCFLVFYVVKKSLFPTITSCFPGN